MLVFILMLIPSLVWGGEFELTSSNVCEVCKCGPGPGMNPREKASCINVGDGKQLKVSSLPHYVTSLVIENAPAGILFLRGVIKVNNEGDTIFRLNVSNASHLEVTEKSISLLGTASEIRILIDTVENINFNAKSVSASKPGRLILRVVRSGTVSIDSKSFDVLNEAFFGQIQTLRLSMGAFKPNLPVEQPEIKIVFRKVGSIPMLPSDTFASAQAISIVDCNISEIESGAFSGFSVNTIYFLRTNIDRVHSRAYPEKSLVNRLAFENCSLTSVAEKAISSAISSLEIKFSTLASLSEEAVFSHVAKVEMTDNTFQTLSHRSFVFQSWNEITFSRNRINFMERGSLIGIEAPGIAEVGNNVTLVFNENHIHYANKDALKMVLPSSIESSFDDNMFYKYCECGIESWLTVVCGGESSNTSLLNLDNLLSKSSQCQVAELSRPCFRETLVKMSVYSQKFCSSLQTEGGEEENVPSCMLTNQINLWDVILQHVEVNSNRGILLVLLVFALLCSFVVALLTLCRWIIYKVRAKAKCHNKSQEWNFTKIEEKTFDKRDSQFHESLPLTGVNSSDTSTQNKEEGPISVSADSEDDDNDLGTSPGPRCPPTETTHTTLETEAARCRSPPKPTFYDEMICLLQEKLEDPNNYATVADSQTTCFYQDPHDLVNK